VAVQAPREHGRPDRALIDGSRPDGSTGDLEPGPALERRHELRDEVKMRWGRLSEDDLDRWEGSSGTLSSILQERYGYAREQADREIAVWLRAMR
jgi:uncharacterized protein YjbJ (UPF0337 family)